MGVLNEKRYKDYYNKLNLEHKLYVKVEPELQSIWIPVVKDGAFIKIC
jgi:hypothetical protein